VLDWSQVVDQSNNFAINKRNLLLFPEFYFVDALLLDIAHRYCIKSTAIGIAFVLLLMLGLSIKYGDKEPRVYCV
jgi:hypothetical protein